MIPPLTLLLALVPLLPSPAGPDGSGPDQAPARLRALLGRPASMRTFSGGGVPREVFHETGDDNVVALLVQPDVDGDGLPEVVTGWDIFKTGDNLTVSKGASFLPGQLAWGLETQDGISGGYFAGQEALATLPDVTGDGVPEVIGSTGGGGRAATVYDGATGAVVQSFDTYLGPTSGWVYAVTVPGDVNGNGTPDFAVATGSDDNAVSMIDGGKTGEHHDPIWRTTGPDAFFSVITVGDVDGDGAPDVVAGAGDNGPLVRCLSGATGQVLWNDRGIHGWHLSAYPDRDGDGVDEVLVASWQANGARLLDGASGGTIWAANVGSTLNLRIVPLDDVDGDGVVDVAVAASGAGARVLDGTDGSLIWAGDPPANVWALDPVADVTGDGVAELAYGDFDGLTRLADGTDGTVLWTHAAGGHKVLALRGAPDLDGDGAAEVLIGAQQLATAVEPLLFVVDADSGVAGGAPELTPSGAYGLGDAVPLELTGATAGLNAWFLLGLGAANLPFGAKGTFGLDPDLFAVAAVVTVPGGGNVPGPFVIPTDPGLLGLEVFVQSFVLTAGTPASGSSSNRVGLAIQP